MAHIVLNFPFEASVMKRKIIVAATQMACTWDLESNLKAAERIVRSAAASGANIILLQELFSAPYFCQDVDDKYFSLAEDVNASPTIKLFTALAKELAVELPVSFFEKAGARYFNSLVVIDADGSIVHHYRKIHIPDAPGYYETYLNCFLEWNCYGWRSWMFIALQN